MARAPRTFSSGGDTETKAGENTGQGKSFEDVTEKCEQTNQPQEIVEVLPTRGLSRFVRVIWLLRRLRNARFRRTRCEGFFSFKQRRCNETNQYHATQQSPHENDWLPGNENPHGRTSENEERLAISAIILRKSQLPFSSFSFLFPVTFSSSGMRESTFQIRRQIHVLCRNVNGYVQTSFAAEVSAQFLPRGIHEPAFSRDRHA